MSFGEKFKILREMGVDGFRTSHNPPAPEFMELADRMGFLIVSEAFDMWERPKTTYDYARFFVDWAQRDVASWVRRDRNHPSLLLWSIGNEIYDTHADDHGQEITRRLMGYVRENDPEENALITIGSNYMPWEGAQKCADIVKIAGYNYGEKYYEAHHKAHPDWVIREKNRPVNVGRGGSQTVLDYSNPAVRDNIFNQLDALYSRIPDLAYVKWDANRHISDAYSHALDAAHVEHLELIRFNGTAAHEGMDAVRIEN